MATDLGRSKAAVGVKYETFLAEKLEQARKRIRWIDVAAAGLGLAIGFLAYGLGMALADRAWDLAAPVRLLALLAFLGGAAAYLTFALLVPLYRQVNLRYAAKELERTLPGSKNSVINWLDLRDDNLPPAIRGAVGRRAANDLAKADLDRALSARRAVWLGGVAGGFAAVVLVFFLSSPAQFWSLMGRAFLPFGGGTIAQATEIRVITPPGGHVKVPANQSVDIVVQVSGKVPPEARWRGPANLGVQTDDEGNVSGFDKVPPDIDAHALMLHLRYSPSGAYTQFPLERDGQNNWRVRVPANRVLNGFYYRVTGGDAQTPEYHVQVESTPLISEFQVTYHYPAFLRTNDFTNKDPNWKAIRNTRVSMVVRTNRTLKEGSLKLTIDGEDKELPGTLLKDAPEAIRFEYVLVRNASYEVRFTARSGETYDERTKYSIEVDPTTRVHFQYPDYLGLAKADFEVPLVPDLKAVRGTRAILTYHHNQPVQKGQLILRVGAREVSRPAVKLSKHPEALRFPEFTLDQEGRYRFAYTSANGSEQTTKWYSIRIIPDDPPRVALTNPAEYSKLPANGLLKLEGWAKDDFGIKNLTLRMRVMKNRQVLVANLEPKVYREGKTLRTGQGHYPRDLDYKDFVELAKVRNDKQQPFKLVERMEIEYWLEATDNCEYPDARTGAHTAESKHHILAIEPPEKKSPQQQEKEKQDAQNDQKNHQQEQDKKLSNQKDEPRPNDSNPENQPQKQGEKKPQDQKPNQAEKNAEKNAKKLDEKLKNREKKGDKENEKGKAKGNGSAHEKDRGGSKRPPESSQNQPKQEKGNGKSKPQDQAADKKGEGKEGGDKSNSKGAGPKNDEGKEKSKADRKNGGKNNADKGGAKGEGQKSTEGGQKKDKPADTKAGPKQNQTPSERKGEGNSADQNKADAKDQGPRNEKNENKMNGQSKEAKEGSSAQDKGASKPAPKDGDKKPKASDSKENVGKPKAKPNKQSGESQAKDAGKEGKNGQQGEAKDHGQPKPDGKEKSTGEAKGQKDSQPRASKTKGRGSSSDSAKGAAKEKGPNPEQSAASGKEKSKPKGKHQGEGQSKTEGSEPTGPDSTQKNQDRSQEGATMKDVREQDEKLDNEDPDAQREAARNLKKMAQQAKDQKVRQAAKEALKKRQENQGNDSAAANKGQDPKKKGPEGKGKSSGKESGPKKEGPGKEKREGPKGSAKGTPKERDPKAKEQGTAKGPPRNRGQLPKNWEEEDVNAKPTKPKYGQEAGDLTLDNLMEKLSKMSPEERRKLLKENDMTEKDYQDLKDYHQAKNAKTIAKTKGRKSGKLRDQGPRQVTKDATKSDKVSQGGGRPPAEYADILEQYSRKLRDRAPSKP